MQLTAYSGGYLRTVLLTRLSEWQAAVITIAWGVSAVLPASTYSTAAGYSGFREVLNQYQFGYGLIVLGSLRLVILALNGIWQPMYFVRAGAALIQTMLWTAIASGFVISGAFGALVTIVPVFLVFEAANVFRAMNDASEAERIRRSTAA